jgi:hypothetical protein
MHFTRLLVFRFDKGRWWVEHVGAVTVIRRRRCQLWRTREDGCFRTGMRPEVRGSGHKNLKTDELQNAMDG